MAVDPNAENTQEGTDAESGRPDWLPSGGEFSHINSPEELATAYAGAVRKITETGQRASQQEQELAALRSEIAEIQATQQTAQQQSETTEIERRWAEAVEMGDAQAMLQINAMLAQMAAEQVAATQPSRPDNTVEMAATLAIAEMARENQDWPEYEAKVGEMIMSNPVLSKMVEAETSPKAVAGVLSTALKLVKYEAGATAATGVQATIDELNRQAKNQAQTMTGTNSQQEAESYWDKVKANSGTLPSFRL